MIGCYRAGSLHSEPSRLFPARYVLRSRLGTSAEEHSSLPEFRKMAKGMRHDYAAAKAAFSSRWSNGQVEAQVNCLKLQKRMVFGRANFDLLRLRVLRR